MDRRKRRALGASPAEGTKLRQLIGEIAKESAAHNGDQPKGRNGDARARINGVEQEDESRRNDGWHGEK